MGNKGSDTFKRFGRRVAAGTVLFREGELGSTMYVIQKGKVRITRAVGDREALLAVLPAGEFFGEMAIITNSSRSATATVEEDAMLLEIDAATFEAMVRARAEIALRMIKRLAMRLEQANRQIEVLLHRTADHRVMHYLANEASERGEPHQAGLLVQVPVQHLCDHLGLNEEEVARALERLIAAKLVVRTWEDRFVVADVSELTNSQERIEIQDRFGEK